MGDKEDVGKYMETSLVVTDSKGLADENPALSLRCGPNSHPP